MDVMVKIELLNNEWYLLLNQMLRLKAEFPDNHIVADIVKKLESNVPNLDYREHDNKESFQREYEIIFGSV